MTKIEKISKVLIEMSLENENFPIIDLVKIIISYVYEVPTQLFDKFHISYILNSECEWIYGLSNGLMVVKFDEETALVIIDKNGRKISKLNGALGEITEITEGRNVIIGACSDGCIYIWRQNIMDEFMIKQILFGHKANVSCVYQLTSGDIISFADDNVVKIWQKNEQDKFIAKTTVEWKYNDISIFSELKNGDIACGLVNGEVVIWRPIGNIINDILAPNYIFPITKIIEVHGQDLFVCGGDIQIWRKRHEEDYWEFRGILIDDNIGVADIIQIMILDIPCLITCSPGEGINLWRCDGETWKCYQQIKITELCTNASITSVTLYNLVDNTILVLAGENITILYWENGCYHVGQKFNSAGTEKLTLLADKTGFVFSGTDDCIRVY